MVDLVPEVVGCLWNYATTASLKLWLSAIHLNCWLLVARTCTFLHPYSVEQLFRAKFRDHDRQCVQSKLLGTVLLRASTLYTDDKIHTVAP